MRIGIDYTAAVRQGAGIGRYTRNLFRALADLDAKNQYKLFVAGGWGEGDGLGGWPANQAALPCSSLSRTAAALSDSRMTKRRAKRSRMSP